MPRNLMTFLFGKPASTRRDMRAVPRRQKFWVELLEDRTVLAAHFATGAAVGTAGTVAVFDSDTQQQVTSLTPYGADFTGGVNVAMGDVTGDGTADIITATATGGSHVKVFDGATFAEVRSFLAFADGFLGGINIATGDIDKDGSADIVVGAASGPPNVEVFSGANSSVLHSFLAYDSGFVGGVRVAVGDINGDGQKDIVTGSGFGADGNVRVFDGATESLLRSFLVFTGGFNGGLNVAAGDLNDDGMDDILVGADASAGPHVKSFDGKTGQEEASFFAFDTTFVGGVVVAVVTGASGNEIAVGANGTQHVKTFNGTTYALVSSEFLPGGTVSGGLGQEPANAPPVLASIGNRTGTAQQAIAFTLSATDADAADTLTFSASGLPTGATLDASTGAFSWTPTAAQTGTFTVTFTVSDGKTTDFETVAFTISGSNVAPTITSNGGGATAAVSVAENTTAVTTVAATDANASDTLTYSLIGGADQGAFAIDPSTGALTFVGAPNFENPTDVGADHVYNVTVQVSDGTLTDTQDIAVTVTDANEAPTITSNGGGATAAVSVAENTTAVTTVAATDPDAGATLTYSITGGADQALFSIDPSTGALAFLSAPTVANPGDVGADNVYNVTVQVSDGTNPVTQNIAITVTAAGSNVAPVITSNGGGATAAVSVAENTTAVTTVAATDANASDTLTYSLIGGADQGAFAIDPSTGALTFVGAPNFENPTDVGADHVYNVTVQVSDGTLTDTQDIAVTVTDANEAPTITSLPAVNARENQTAAVNVTATDPDAGATLTYSITGGADQELFSIDPNTGAVTFLIAPTVANPGDVGADNVYNVTVQVSDGTNPVTQNIAITVTAAGSNVAPVITSNGGGATAAVNVAENTTAVTVVTATDPDTGDVLTYSIIGGADQGAFSIDPSTGVLTFLSAPNFESPTDAGADHVYNITVQVTDGTANTTQDIAVTVTDANDNTPTITSDGGGATAMINVAENTVAVTTVTATDADAGTTFAYSITGGADAAKFAIDPGTGALTFLSPPDFENPTDAGADHVYNVTVQVSDGTNTATQDIAVTVTDANEAPTITSNGGGATATVNTPENQTEVTTVVAADPDAGAVLTYSIVGGADQGAFDIDPSTGALTFLSAPDFENPTDVGADHVYNVTVQVSDGTNTATQDIAVTVTDANDNTPVITSNGGGANAMINVAENTVAVTTVTATDADAGTTFAYSITGGPDAAKFGIDPNTGALMFLAPPDFENPTDANTDNVYNVTVQVSDGMHTVTQNLAVTVTDTPGV